jgi:hypothetical protein
LSRKWRLDVSVLTSITRYNKSDNSKMNPMVI